MEVVAPSTSRLAVNHISDKKQNLYYDKREQLQQQHCVLHYDFHLETDDQALGMNYESGNVFDSPPAHLLHQ